MPHGATGESELSDGDIGFSLRRLFVLHRLGTFNTLLAGGGLAEVR